MDPILRRTVARTFVLAGCGILIGALSPSAIVMVGLTLVLIGTGLWMDIE